MLHHQGKTSSPVHNKAYFYSHEDTFGSCFTEDGLLDLVLFGPSVWEPPLKKTSVLPLHCLGQWAENTQESCSRCTSLIEAGAAHSVTCQPRETCEISRIFSTLGTLIFQNHPNLSKKISLPRLPEAIHHYFQGVQMIRLSLSSLNSSSSVLSAPYEEIFNLNATCCVASACAASIFYSGALSTS